MKNAYQYWCQSRGYCYQYDRACGCGSPRRNGVACAADLETVELAEAGNASLANFAEMP